MARIKTKAIILIACLILLTSFQVRSFAREITVGKGLTYSSITEALHVSNEGDTIEENQLEDNIIGVYLYSSPNNIIRNNTSYGRADYTTEETNGNGVHLWKSPNNTIEGNHIRKHRDGIYVEFSPGNLIRNNHCERNVR